MEKIVQLMSTGFPGRDVPLPATIGVREYAVAHHAKAVLREGAENRDASVMGRAIDMWRTVTADTAPRADADIITASSENAIPLKHVPADMPVWAIGEGHLKGADDGLTAWVRPAVTAARNAGYSWLVDNALAIVVSLHPRQLNEATSSWTVGPLPCTVYTDYYAFGELMGKDLVHEAAHSWLNDCLAVTGDTLDGPAEFWSPWRQRYRTPFGIVHSAFAFACVVNYLSWLREHSDDARVAAYCAQRIADEQDRLTQTLPGITRSLEVVRDERVRQMVQAELETALAGVGA
ncbi:HEXXH motif-containing putative peptide modification protein [Spirillospora sp. NBC_00431]